MRPPSIAFVAADTTLAQTALRDLQNRYASVPPVDAEVVVALGGDGLMLETLHALMSLDKPIYGMNRGSVGFLMNAYAEGGLLERIVRASAFRLNLLRMKATSADGRVVQALAINEVSLLRETRQTAKLRLSIDGRVRLPELICDGVLLCTPAGSTAYNLSAHGPILPVGANILALTPISAFRPRQWRGAILPCSSQVCIEVLEADKRPVSAVADYTEAREVVRVDIHEDRSSFMTLLFDPDHSLEERILTEQFLV